MNNEFDEETASQNFHYSELPVLNFAWLYIVVDIRDMRMAKIGLTRRETPYQRIAQGKTYNPFLTLFSTYELSKCTFGTSQKELDEIERYIHRRSVFGEPIKHLFTGRGSEWFFIDPDEAEFQIDWILAKRGFAVDNKVLWSNDQENEKFNNISVELMKKIKTIYRPQAWEFEQTAQASGIPFELYKPYCDYLAEFHQRDSDGKIYL